MSCSTESLALTADGKPVSSRSQRVPQRAVSASSRETTPVAAWVAFVTICILWGTTFLGIRIAIETIPTLLVSSLRFVGAGLILLVFSLLTRARFPEGKRDWIDQVVNGVLMSAVGNSLVVFAEHSITSGIAALLAATIPIWMALMESLFGMAPLSRWKIAGLALGFGGVGLLVAPAIGRPDVSLQFFIAVGAMQLSAISWNLGTIRSKRRPSAGDPTAVAAVQMTAGGLAAGIVALATGAHIGASFSFRSSMALLYLMIFGSVIAYSAYVYVLRHLTAGKLSSYAYVNPVVAVIVGSIVLGEAVTLPMIVAMVTILIGVAVIQLEKRRKEIA